MAIARLSRVVLVSPRHEVGVFLSRLCYTGIFHPSEKGGLVQDTQLILLASRAHAVYSEASALIRGKGQEAELEPVVYRSASIIDLVDQLSKRSSEISDALRNQALDDPTKKRMLAELPGLRDAALTVFRDVSRMRVRPGTRRFMVFEGYVPTDSLGPFKSTMGSYFLYSEPISRRQPGIPYVPSLLVNPKAVKLFEGITLSLGVPKYNEVDPTPIVAFVFPLFFGIMFSDLGRGLVLLAAGYAIRKNARDDLRYLGRLLLVLGASAMVVGALRGLAFGVPLPYAPLLPSPTFLTESPSLMTITFWLEVGIVFGTFHLAAGYVLAVVNRILSRDYAEAFLGYAPTLFLYSATIPFVFALAGTGLDVNSVFTSMAPTPFFSTLLGLQVPVSEVALLTFPPMVASLLVLVFGRSLLRLYATHRARPALTGLVHGVGDALVRPAELFVHTISYIRLGILLVVESVLGELLANLLTQGPSGIILAIPGNLAVISIMAFIVYLQDLRLNVYEWFSKFYSGAGRPFTPIVSAGPRFSVAWSFAQ